MSEATTSGGAGGITTAGLEQWIRSFARLIAENKDYLTELDSAIGDGDHGANMDRGMHAVLAKLDQNSPASPSALFKSVGMTLVSTVGGASGPLFGTLFLRVGTSLADTEDVSLLDLAKALRAGLEGIVARGKAQAGDKTMFDALSPVVEVLEAAAAEDAELATALGRALAAAEAGRDATSPMVARKGRASYLGERSAGHLDPGATTVALLVNAAAGLGRS